MNFKPPKTIYLLAFSMFLLGAVSCREPDAPQAEPHTERGVFVVNQGNFTWGNASLSFYSTDSNRLSHKIFYATNQVPLGDVAQSMTIVGDTGLIVVNNSGTIYALDTHNFQYINQIAGLLSPRYILPLAGKKAYISDLYAKKIQIADLQTFSLAGEIYTGHTTEQMLRIGNYVLTNCWNNDSCILKINTTTHSVEDSVFVAFQPNSMALDCHGKLWVLSDGGNPMVGLEKAPALTRIDPQSFRKEAVWEFDDTALSPTGLCANATADTLFFINHHIFRLPANAQKLPQTPFIRANEKSFYALTVSPQNSEIFVSDPIDYTQRGTVYRFRASGEALDTFKAGIIPGYFAFKPFSE